MARKTLTLRCDCGASRTFEVEQGGTFDNGARRMIATIDAAGWLDRSGGGPGWMPAWCPACLEVNE